MKDFFQELRGAWRRLARHSTFTWLAAGTLAFGLGSALFLLALYDQIALRELPVERPRELVLVRLMTVSATGEEGAFGRFGLEEYEELSSGAADTVGLAAYAADESSVRFGTDEVARRVASERVSTNYFDLLGLRPALGRFFLPADDSRRGGAPVVVLGYGAWQRRFAGDRAVLGRTLAVDGEPATVIGVAPRSFHSLRIGSSPEVFRLAASSAASDLQLAGRLAPGVSSIRAQARLRAARAAAAAEHATPQRFMIIDGKSMPAEERLDVAPGARGESDLRGAFSRSVLLTGGMVAVVLLVLWANLANLLATRATDERRQTAIRIALGASRRRVTLGWLSESLLLACVGGAAALLLTLTLGRTLLALLPIPNLGEAIDIRLDFPLAAGAIVLVVATALLVGALAAREASRRGLLGSLRSESSQSTEDRRGVSWRWAVVAVQAGLSVVLLCGMGLLARSLDKLLAIETGLPLDEVVTFRLDLPSAGPAASGERLERLAADFATLPGVERVAYSGEPVLAGSAYYGLAAVEGYEPAAGETVMLNVAPVSPGFFDVLGLKRIAGRRFETSDLALPHRAVVVNERFVERYLRGREAVGRHLSFEYGRGSFAEPKAGDLEIVGVVADRVLGDIREQPQPRVYPLVEGDTRSASFLLTRRTRSPGLASQVAALVREREPEAAIGTLRSLAGQRDLLLVRERFLSGLAKSFGVLTLLLAGLGLYGVIAYATLRRGREIALRIALGAQPRQVVIGVVRAAILAVGAGALAGALVAVPTTRLLSGFLYDVEPGDPVALALALVLLAAVALLACWLPARRAARLDPAPLLRADN